MSTPEKIVENQLKAYNARNLLEFLRFYSDDIKIHDFHELNVKISGIDQLKRVYEDIFENSPNLKCEIINRIVFDNKVFDHEMVTGRKGAEKIEVIAIYEIENDLISKVHFVRK